MFAKDVAMVALCPGHIATFVILIGVTGTPAISSYGVLLNRLYWDNRAVYVSKACGTCFLSDCITILHTSAWRVSCNASAKALNPA